MHTLIVDDEPLARNELAYLLNQCEEISAIEEADSIAGALEKLLQHPIDLVFLDIHLTEESGLELADKINRMPNPPLIVFATAYDEYAIQAFEQNARDYVLKPFELERVRQAVNRVHATWMESQTVKTPTTTGSDTVPVQSEERIFIVKTDTILALEVNQGETTIYTTDKQYIIHEPLALWEKKLDGDPFMRVHRSYLVNVNHIREIQPWFNQTYQLTMSNGLKIPVSRSYLKSFREKMDLKEE